MAVTKKDVTIFVLSDVNEVKAKLFFGLTKRQLISFVVAGVIGFYAFHLARKLGLGAAGALIILMFVSGIVFFAFHFTIHGRNLEKIVMDWWRWMRRPAHRVPRTENIYRITQDKIYEEEVLGIGTVLEKRKKAAGKGKKSSGASKKSKTRKAKK